MVPVPNHGSPARRSPAHRWMQAFDELLLLQRGGSTIFGGRLDQLVPHFEALK